MSARPRPSRPRQRSRSPARVSATCGHLAVSAVSFKLAPAPTLTANDAVTSDHEGGSYTTATSSHWCIKMPLRGHFSGARRASSRSAIRRFSTSLPNAPFSTACSVGLSIAALYERSRVSFDLTDPDAGVPRSNEGAINSRHARDEELGDACSDLLLDARVLLDQLSQESVVGSACDDLADAVLVLRSDRKNPFAAVRIGRCARGGSRVWPFEQTDATQGPEGEDRAIGSSRRGAALRSRASAPAGRPLATDRRTGCLLASTSHRVSMVC